MLTAGVDIGSLATKAVILEAGSGQVLGTACLPGGPRPAELGRAALETALAEADAAREDLSGVVATGYGRQSLPFTRISVTEISCAARGAHFIEPAVRTVIDIGGQDSKVIRCDEEGYPLDFALNDRCAAGTGRFLEVMAGALGTDVEGMSRLAQAADEPARITHTCTVFAESEVVGLLARGAERDAVAGGLCRAVAERTALLARQAGIEPPVMLAGGVGMNRAIAEALRDVLGLKLIVPEEPQLVVATGAAVVAADRETSSAAPREEGRER